MPMKVPRGKQVGIFRTEKRQTGMEEAREELRSQTTMAKSLSLNQEVHSFV